MKRARSNLRNAASLSAYKKSLLKFIGPSPGSVFNCLNCKEIKLLTKLRLGLSHLREHKFKQSFQDTLNQLCSHGRNMETNMVFFFQLTLA